MNSINCKFDDSVIDVFYDDIYQYISGQFTCLVFTNFGANGHVVDMIELEGEYVDVTCIYNSDNTTVFCVTGDNR